MGCMGIVLPAGTFPRNWYFVVAVAAENVLDADSIYAAAAVVVVAACHRCSESDLQSHRLNSAHHSVCSVLASYLMVRSHLVVLFDHLVDAYYPII